MADDVSTDDYGGFNFSFKTMERMHNLLVDCSHYAANKDIPAWKENLKELYKEFLPWLSKEEKKTARNKWGKIEKWEIEINEFTVTYDTDLIPALDGFDFWIRGQMFKHKLSFSKTELSRGLTGQYKKYGLGSNGSNDSDS